jgi:hypothetical protein
MDAGCPCRLLCPDPRHLSPRRTHQGPILRRSPLYQGIQPLSQGEPLPTLLLVPSELLLVDRRVYVPEYRPERGNLCTRVLQEKHDHPTAGHSGYNKG